MDLVVNLSHDGIRLIFDPASQRLKVHNFYSVLSIHMQALSF